MQIIFSKKSFSKFIPVYEKGLEKLQKEGLIFTYAKDSFKEFFVEALKEKGLEEQLVIRIIEQVVELLRIQYISDSIKRKEEVKKLVLQNPKSSLFQTFTSKQFLNFLSFYCFFLKTLGSL